MTSPLRRHSAPAMGRAPKYKIDIAALRKNSCERLAISLEEYNGVDLLNLAVKRDSAGKHRIGGMKQTGRFVSIQTRQLPDLIAALQDAQAKAIARGILQAPSESTCAQNGFVESIGPKNTKPAPASPTGPANGS